MRYLILIASILLATLASASPTVFGEQDCLDAPYEVAKTPNQRIVQGLMTDLRVVLQDFPSLLHTLDTQQLQICVSGHLVTEQAYLVPEDNRIVLSKNMAAGMMMAVLVHEIRHADQLARGICPSSDLAMGQYARATFSLEADANVISLLVAWSQRTQGNAALWRALSDWPMTSDIAEKFEAVMLDTQDVSRAASAAFEQWYASAKRRDLYYVASCSNYLDRQEQTHALPQYLKIPADYLTRLCRMPDGRKYSCKEPEQALRR